MKKKKTILKKLFKKKRKGSKRKRNRKRELLVNRVELGLTVVVLFAAFLIIRGRVIRSLGENSGHLENASGLQADSSDVEILPAQEGPCGRPEIQKNYIVPNVYSRSQMKLKKVKGIVVHYVANPGSTAQENRDYFEGLKDTHTTKASSHFIIGLKGEIIQCIPLDEISYASNQRNKDTVSIECCHPGEDGRFNDQTYQSLVQLAAWLCDTYGLSSADVIRHYDVTGKLCPIYYVKNEGAWNKLRRKIQKRLDNSRVKGSIFHDIPA